jgi:hypothetical protein
VRYWNLGSKYGDLRDLEVFKKSSESGNFTTFFHRKLFVWVALDFLKIK